MTRCVVCGSLLDGSARFCTACGTPQAAAWRSSLPARVTRTASPRITWKQPPPRVVAAGIIALSVVAGVGAAILDPFTGERAATGSPTPGASASLSGEEVSCGVPDLECTRLTVRSDPADEAAGRIDVVFGRHDAVRTRSGTLVIATGGPGGSGLEASEYYLATLPQEVLDAYDVVFFDQRGVGRSSALRCPDADSETGSTSAETLLSPADRSGTAAWVERCLDEAGAELADLAIYETTRVAEDIEAYRQLIDVEELVLYGESYGTSVVQHYAAQYPEHVAALILDAPIDTRLDGPSFAAEQLAAFDDVTDATLDACADDPACRADFGDEAPRATWRALLDRLADGPIEVAYPLIRGGSDLRQLTRGDVLRLAIGLSYTEYERSALLRALAGAARDDFVPLLDLAYRYAGFDPEFVEPLAAFDGSSALYYAVRCRNYADLAGADLATDALERAERQLAEEGNAFAATIWDELPCIAGFAEFGVPIERPGAPTGDFPTMVLTATTDPATPTDWAARIADAASDGYLVRTTGGGHVTFGHGFSCPDDIVVDLLRSGDTPEGRVTDCPGYVIEPYVSLPLASLEAYHDVADALVAIEMNLFASPAYLVWDGMPTDSVCPLGGSFELTWHDSEAFDLHGCELIAGWPLSGSMTLGEDGRTVIEISAPNADLHYESSAQWHVTVSGTLDGRQVDISRKVTP